VTAPDQPVLSVTVVQFISMAMVAIPPPELPSQVTVSAVPGDAAVAVPPEVVARTKLVPFIVFVPLTVNHDPKQQRVTAENGSTAVV